MKKTDYSNDMVEYIIERKYKGKIVHIKVRDGFIDGRRSTTIKCKYNPIVIGFSDGTDEKVQYFINKNYEIAKKEIDENSFVKKLTKIFR